MTYARGTELSTVYYRARTNGYGFVASNITETNILTGLINGAERVESDLVAQVKRDTAAFAGNGDPETGLNILANHIEKLGTDADVGVFLNVDHVPAEDGDHISSTRVVKGEIDEHGNLTPDRDGRAPPADAGSE